MRRTICLMMVAPLLAVSAVDALAQSDKPAPKLASPSAADIAKAKAHYKKGAELFDAKKFEEAVTQFKESFRLSRNPLLLYNIGFTLDELGDKDKALFYYEKFLSEVPEDAKNRDVAKERAAKLSREMDPDALYATDSASRSAAAPAADEKPAKPAAGVASSEVAGEFQHNVVDEAPPGKPLDLTAFVPQGSGLHVKLFFRTAGASRFVAVDMQPRYNELVGRIPAARLTGGSLQYYIEVHSAGGEVVARSGRSTSPNVVLIEKGAKPRYYPDLTDDRSWDASDDSSAEPSATGGFTDIQSKKFQGVKWGTTGGALGLLALSATFYFVASDAASSLEGEAFSSNNLDDCPTGPPCRAFSDKQKSLQSRGQRFETLANVSLGLGVAAAIGAGVAWYWEIRETKKAKSDKGVAATPVIADDFVGAAAALRF